MPYLGQQTPWSVQLQSRQKATLLFPALPEIAGLGADPVSVAAGAEVVEDRLGRGETVIEVVWEVVVAASPAGRREKSTRRMRVRKVLYFMVGECGCQLCSGSWFAFEG